MLQPRTMYIHEIIVHSIPANRERKKERKEIPPTHQKPPHTDIQNYSQDIKGHWMPSLENWGGGLKSLLRLANSPHTSSAQTKNYNKDTKWQHTLRKQVMNPKL